MALVTNIRYDTVYAVYMHSDTKSAYVYKDLYYFCLLEWVTVAAGSVEVQAISQLRLCPHLHDIVHFTPLPLPSVQYSRLRHCPPLRINHPLFPGTADTQQALC